MMKTYGNSPAVQVLIDAHGNGTWGTVRLGQVMIALETAGNEAYWRGYRQALSDMGVRLDRVAAEPQEGEPSTFSDSDKLRLLAAWFDMWDATRHDDRQRILDDENNPGKNDVQRDLRRIAASLEGKHEG